MRGRRDGASASGTRARTQSRRRERRAPREDVAAHGVDALENARPARDDRPKLEAGAEGKPPRQRTARVEQRARARRFERHQPRQRASHAPSAICVRPTPNRVEVLERQVDASLAPVDRDVLPEIGELQRRADRVAFDAALRVVGLVQREQQAPDRIRRAAAIVDERRRTSDSARRRRPARTRTAGRETARAAARARGSRRRARGTARPAAFRRARSRRARARNAPSAACRSAGVASPSSAMSSAARAKR